MRGGLDIRESVQDDQQKPFRNTMPLAEENWAYSRFCILSFLNVRPSHLILIIFKHQPLGQQKATGRHRSQSGISTLSPKLGLVVYFSFCQSGLKDGELLTTFAVFL